MIRIFRHYIPKSLLILGLLEVVILILSLYVAETVRFIDANEPVNHISLLHVILFTFIMLVVMTAMGLYQRDVKDSTLRTIFKVASSIGLGFLVMTPLFYLFPELIVGRGVMVGAAVSAFVGILGCRYFINHFTNHNFLMRRAIVLGAGKRATRIERLMVTNGLDSINIKGFIPLEGEAVEVNAHRVLGDSTKIAQIAEKFDADEVIVAIDDRRKSYPADQLIDIKMSGVEIVEDISFWEKQTGKIEIASLQPSHLIYADGYVQSVVKPVSKRIFDIVVSLGILALASPIMLVTALAIWLESGCKGSILYRQTRVGAGGRCFRIAKFRSMTENAEANGAQWAVENDPRITRIGAFIRKTRIDELPQVFNVLKGTMSFVGPRPERPEFEEDLKKDIPYYTLRHGTKPGITGWAQVKYPYGASVEDTRNKLQYDLYYVKNYSIFLDLMIIFQTLQVVLWQKGSR